MAADLEITTVRMRILRYAQSFALKGRSENHEGGGSSAHYEMINYAGSPERIKDRAGPAVPHSVDGNGSRDSGDIDLLQAPKPTSSPSAKSPRDTTLERRPTSQSTDRGASRIADEDAGSV